MKVGTDPASDLRRGMIIRSVIDDPANLPANHIPRDPKTLVGKNAGPTGNVLMIDANQVSFGLRRVRRRIKCYRYGMFPKLLNMSKV